MTAPILPPPPDTANHPLVDTDGTITRAYGQWFFNLYYTVTRSITGAPNSSTYVLNTDDPLLPNSQTLASLSTGFAKITTSSGIFTTQATIASADLANTTVTADFIYS